MVCTLGNLVKADKEEKIRKTVDEIAGFLDDKSIVLQDHSVRALAKISHAFPDLAVGIMDRLVASRYRFPGNRVGFLIESM